jgi:hypothetical protein
MLKYITTFFKTYKLPLIEKDTVYTQKKETIKSKYDIDYENMVLKYPVGSKVISIPNEPNKKGKNFNELTIGIVVTIDRITQARQPVVIYKDIKTGNENLTFSEPMIYSEEVERALLKLTWDERWNVFSHGLSVICAEHKTNRENA